MEVFKLKLKLGTHEFEAEGSQDYVEKQRDIFLDKLDATTSQGQGSEQNHVSPGNSAANGNGAGHAGAALAGAQPPAAVVTSALGLPTLEEIQTIANQQGDIITLSALPSGVTAEEDAFMLLLLAHKVMRSVDSVSTDHLLAGMKQSGRPVDRLDRVFMKIDSSLIIRTGVKRGTKYRLTVPGVTKAKEIARQLLQTLVA